MQWLARSETLALAAEWSIRSEAMWRRTLAASAEALGIPTPGRARRQQECRDAALQRSHVQADDAARPRRSPVVNWHVAGSGPPLMLLNGWAGSGLAWPTGWLRSLEAHYRVIRVDQRGSGWSHRAPAPVTIADPADDAPDVLG